ncbi:MAG: DUF362 domain-containing protein [Chloroflexi bacterium]|nr:DUF362 domain-containing protein [Chloroflexota bacterium]
MTDKVFLASLDNGYPSAISAGLQWIGFVDQIKPSDTVFIKPNLTFPTYRKGVMTNPAAIEAAILAIREYTSHIYIGESDAGGYNRFSMDQVYRETGIWEFAEKYGVQVVNLSHGERRTITFRYRNRDFSLDLPCLLMDEIDMLITMPVPKVHANTGVSLTFKNQWGCIPEPTDRLRLHPYFKHVILEVNKAVKTKVAIIDGKYGLNVNGPMRGVPVDLNWVMVANDIGCGARVACDLMQMPFEKISHLEYATTWGLIPDSDEITINQNIDTFLKEKFVLTREWTDYPGFIAFHSPLVAYLGYFSPLAKLLHRVLYLFREPFY